MTDIKVILEEKTSPIDTLSQDERDMLFDKIAMDNPDINRIYIDSFSAMQTESIKDKSLFIRPELQELLLRKIIQLVSRNNINTIIIPIVTDFDTVKTHAKISQANRGPARGKSKYGGQEGHGLRIQFDTQILVVTNKGLNYISAQNEPLEVTGLIVNNLCDVPQTLGPKGLEVLKAVGLQQGLDIDWRLLSGYYTVEGLANSCSDHFTMVLPKFDGGQRVDLESSGGQVMTYDKLTTIYDYIVTAEVAKGSLEVGQSICAQLGSMFAGGADYKSLSRFCVSRSLVSLLAINGQIGKKPPQAAAKDSKDRLPIFDIMEELHYGVFCNTFRLAVLAAVEARGMSKIWTRAQLKGKDDQSVRNAITEYKLRSAREAFHAAIKRKIAEERVSLNTYKLIIESKLGSARLKGVNAVSVKTLLAILRPPERKVVEAEFERRTKYLEAILNNKCPHVKIYYRFRKATTDAAIGKLLGELRGFFANPKAKDEMITCKNCKFDIICPHVLDFTEMELAGKFFNEIRAKLTHYIDKAVVRDQYYCKICGELISSIEAFGEVSQGLDSTSSMNEELKNFIWGEIAVLTKYLKFGTLVDVPRLISGARDACYPFIFEIEKQILKSKTNSADEIKAKKRLYVTIYAFAYFIHIIMSADKKAEISFRNYKDSDSKNAIVGLIKHSLDMILMARNISIREIHGMSPDIVKQTLITAFKSLQGSGRVSLGAAIGDADDTLLTILFDPVYQYFYKINVLDDLINHRGGSKPPKKHDVVDRLDKIMGGTLAQLIHNGDLFAKAAVPTFKGWHEELFIHLEGIHGGKITKGNDLIFDLAYPGYCASSFKFFVSILTSHAHLEPMYIDVAAKLADPAAPLDVKLRPIHEALHKKYRDFETKETRLLNYRLLRAVQGYTFLEAKTTRKWILVNVPLSHAFDEDGTAHKWDVYITGAEGSRKEITVGMITDMLGAGQKFTEPITDRKCSICGILYSVINTLSESKIKESLHARHMVSNFFRFYESRCPKGNLHDIEKNTCKKCGLVNSYLMNMTTAAALNYYREFRDVYMRERAEFSGADAANISTEPLPKPLVDSAAQYAAEYTMWAANFNIILTLANNLKINHRLFSALGAVEKQEYGDIQSGAFIPPEIEERNSTRAIVIDAHIKNLLTEYNQLRNFHKLTRPSPYLSAIVEASGINKHKIAELSKTLPSIFNDHTARLDYFRKHKKAREIIAFCIQSFCEMCLRLWDDPHKETEKLRHNFVEYIVRKTLRGEELVSKPGHFNWSLLFGDKDVKEKTEDSNYSKDIDVESDKEGSEIDTDDDFGDTASPMMAADFDIDEDPDRDPEDTDQDWKVGDDLGL